MRDEVFIKMDSEYAKLPGETEQEYMSRILKAADEDHPGYHSFNESVGPRFISCDAKERFAVYEFTPKDWQANQNRILHGGIVAAVHDICMGILAKYYLPNKKTTATVQMDLEFLSPVPIDEPVLVRAYCEKPGRRVCFLRSVVCEKKTGKILSSAKGIFM